MSSYVAASNICDGTKWGARPAGVRAAHLGHLPQGVPVGLPHAVLGAHAPLVLVRCMAGQILLATSYTWARAKAWCLLTHAEVSLSRTPRVHFSTQETRVANALYDVASDIWQALVGGAGLEADCRRVRGTGRLLRAGLRVAQLPQREAPGRAQQVEPMQPALKAPGSVLLN